MALEFEVDGLAYKARAMDAFTQMEVVSKIAPLMSAGAAQVFPMLKYMKDHGLKSFLDIPREDLFGYFTPFAAELAKMPADDRKVVVAACLELVERRVGEGRGWAPIWSVQAGRAMFEDINTNAYLMLRIVAAVIEGTLSRFF